MQLRLITFLAFFALVALLAVQVYVIGGFYDLKRNEFDKKYGEEVFTALELVKSDFNYDPLDSALTNLDRFAYKLFDKQPSFDIIQDDARIKRQIASEFETIIREQEQISTFLRQYLPKRGLDNDFITWFKVRELKLLNNGDPYVIIHDPRAEKDSIETQSRNAIFVRSNAVSLNNCEFKLDFYIDFNHKQKIILKEMRIIFLMVSFILMTVLLAFVLTVRNMLRHKKISDIKTDFINNMTHELKTPLSTISIASSSLTMEAVLRDKEKSRTLSEIIKKQNKHLTQMIDHILDISVLDRNEFRVDCETTNIKQFIKDQVETFKLESKKRYVEVKEDYDITDELNVDVDRFQMTRVINNLMTNAVKYCDTTPKLNISVKVVGDNLKLLFKDNGIGVRKEDQRRIFTKFYRCNHDHKHKVKGLGLGLYFVKRIIDEHGGTIGLDSKVGYGSTFKITIPLKHN